MKIMIMMMVMIMMLTLMTSDNSSGKPCHRVRGEAGPEPTRRDERGAEGVSGQQYKFEIS